MVVSPITEILGSAMALYRPKWQCLCLPPEIPVSTKDLFSWVPLSVLLSFPLSNSISKLELRCQ